MEADRLSHRCHNKLTRFTSKVTSEVLDLMLNLQEGSSDLNFVVAVSQSLSSFSS